MSRPRSNVLKVGDKIKHLKMDKDGVVVFVEPALPVRYSVHFYPQGRGLFKYDELEKVKPLFKLAELVDEEDLITPIDEKEPLNA
jgi:hypothetical protein